MLVVTALLGLVLGVVDGALVTYQKLVGRVTDRSTTNNQLSLAVQQLANQIRSANVLYPTTGSTSPFYGTYPSSSVPAAMVIYTQAYADNMSVQNRCVEWRLTKGTNGYGSLQTRYWSTDMTTVTSWTTVASGVAAGPNGAFTLDSTSLYGDRLVDIDLEGYTTASQAQPVEVQESVEGRDSEYGYPSSVCDTAPPGGW